ncbi:MAG: hypothetical protein BGO90_14815 [Legionella sp. 40-6]|nr:hypothetical protein [Legionella sp.]OJY32359.1 MAG: hypothetical protein BGO90_14815 [Legionella sp. 40-6]
MIKKTTLAVLGLAASSLANAGTMGPTCVPGSVTVPCAAESWELGADALYLQSLYGAHKTYQLGYNPVTGIDPRIVDTGNDWDWGYRIMGAYHFGTGSDVTVNWTHFHSNASAAGTLAPFPVSLTAVTFVPAAGYDNNERLDQVNIVMGQHVDFSPRDNMRMYAGMQYANIQSQAQTYINTPLIVALTGTPFNVFNNTDYKGFGPTIGIDYNYDLYNGLYLFANGAGSLLYGTSRYQEGFVASEFNAITAQVYARKKAIVPSLEAKLGVNYVYNFPQFAVNLDAGYQVINYFNVLSAQQFQDPTANISSVNYGVYGPYFGLKLVGNA